MFTSLSQRHLKQKFQQGIQPRSYWAGLVFLLVTISLAFAAWQRQAHAGANTARAIAFRPSQRGANGDAAALARLREKARQQRCAMAQYLTATDEWMGQSAPSMLWAVAGWEPLGPGAKPAPTEFAPCASVAARNALRFNAGTAAGVSLFASTESEGLWRSAAAGGWTRLSATQRGTVAMSVGEPSALYLSPIYLAHATPDSHQLVIERSQDQGRTFTASTNGLADQALEQVPLLLDPNDEQHLWTGGRRVWHSRSGADDWRAASAHVPGSAANRVSALAVPATNSAHVLAGTSEGHILRTYQAWQTDGESVWSFVQPRSGFVSALAYEPENANRAYAAYATYGGAHLWRTIDGGASWQSIDGAGATALPDVAVLSLAIDPLRPQRLYAGTEAGLFVSPDGGEHWAVEATPFGAATIAALAITQKDTQVWLNVFADGAGVWRLSLTPKQAAQQQCNYVVTPRTQRFEGAGGFGSVNVTTGSSCTWSVSNVPNWISIREGSSGAGNGVVTFALFDNPASELRSATLSVGDQSFTIEQDGGGGRCEVTPITPFVTVRGVLAVGDCTSASEGILRFPTDLYSFEGRQGDAIAINFTSDLLRGRLRLFGPGGQVLVNVDGYGQTSPYTLRLPAGDVYTTLPANGEYRIEVSSYGGRGAYSVQLLRLTGGCANASAIPAQQAFNAAGGTASVQIAVPTDCIWLAESNVNWVTINSPRRQYSSQTLSLAVAPNLGGYRFTRLYLAGAFLTIEQSGANGSCAPTPIANGETVAAAFNPDDCRRTRMQNSSEITAPVKRYAFTATAGQRLFTAFANPDPNSFQQPYTYFYGPGNALLGESDQVSSYARNQFTIPADGTYVIEMMGSSLNDANSFTFTLNLISSGCGAALAPSRHRFESAGGAGEFKVATFNNCAWRASTGASWITLTNANANPTGSGNGRVSFNVAANTTSQFRGATVIVAGQSVTIEQAGAGGTCLPRALSASQIITGQAITGNLSVSSCRSRYRLGTSNYFSFAADTFSFSGKAGQSAAFRINPTNWGAYVYLSNAAGEIIGEGSVPFAEPWQFTLPADGNYLLELTTFQARSSGAYSGSFALTGGVCVPVMSPAYQSFDAGTGTGSVTVTAAAGCSWTAQSSASWLTITEGASGNGKGVVKFSLASNNVSTLRRAALAINSLNAVIEQAGLGGNCLSRPLTPGQTVSGELSNADCRSTLPSVFNQVDVADVYAVNLQAGDVVFVSSTGTPFAPALALRDASGKLLATHDSFIASRLPVEGFVTIQRADTYYLHVRGLSLSYAVTLLASSTACSVTLGASGQTFESNGGSGSFTVAAADSCAWRALSDASWIALAANSGRGNGRVDFTLAANPSNALRTGTIIANGQAFMLTQAGAGGACAPIELPVNTTVNGRASAGDCPSRLRTTNNPLSRRYRFTYTDGQLLAATMTAPVGQTNLNLNPELIVTDANGRELVRPFGTAPRLPVRDNTYFTLPAAGTYFLEVVSYFSSQAEYRLTLATPTSCAVAVSPVAARLETGEATGTLRILTQAGCEWSAGSGVETWLTLTTPTGLANGTGPGTVNYRVAANTTSVARLSALRVTLRSNSATADFPVEQAGPGSTCGAVPLTLNQAVQGTLSAADCSARYYDPSNNQMTQADCYSFTGQAGETIALLEPADFQLSSFLNYTISLANGLALARYESLGRNEKPFAQFTLPVSGEYWLELARRSDASPAVLNYAVTVLSASSNCQPTLARQLSAFDSAAGSGSFDVTLNAGCNWRAVSTSDWLTLTNASGTGNGTVRFSVAANTMMSSRYATIYVGQQPFYVLQGGVESTCVVSPLIPGRLVNGSLSSSDCNFSGFERDLPPSRRQVADRYTFSGKTGDRFSAFLIGGGRHLRLFDAAGTLLVQHSNAASEITSINLPADGKPFILPADGTYFVDVVDSYRINLGGYQLVVNVAPNDCETAVSNLTQRFEASGGAGNLRLITNNNCAWNIVALADWVTLANASGSGSGSATVNFTVAANTTAQRRVTRLVVNGQIFTLIQAGTAGSCAVQTLTPNQIVNGELTESDCLPLQSLTASLLIGTTPQFVADRYSFTATANQQIRIQTGDHWQPAITLLDANGAVLNQFGQPERYFNPQAVSLPDTGYFSLPNAGTYQIEIASQGRFAYQLFVGLTPTGCTYATTSSTRFYDASGTGAAQTGVLNVFTNSDCPWTVTSSAPWLTLTNASGSGSGTVNFMMANNAADTQRLATLRLSDQSIEIAQAGKNGRCSPIPIVPGQPFIDNGQTGQCQASYLTGVRYTFAGRAGDRFSATLSFDRQVFYPRMVITDAAGGLVLSNTLSTAIPIVPLNQVRLPDSGTFTLPATGAYFIEIFNERNYTLNVSLQGACVLSASLTPQTPREFEAGGGLGLVAITAGAGCNWALDSNAPWITTTALGTGNGNAAFMVLPNPTAAVRTGQIVYPGGSLTITQQARAAVTSAASYRTDELAPGAIGAIFGVGLAKSSVVAATTPLPTTLADTVVRVRDSVGVTREAPLFVVTQGQINFLIPPQSALGPAALLIVNGGAVVASGTINLVAVAPGLFAANADAQGPPAGTVLRVRNGVQSFEPLIVFDQMSNRYVNHPIDLGPAGDEVFLILYGTGWRLRAANGAASATLGAVPAPLLYAGAQGALAGLDQLNLRLPREFAGRGALNLIFTVEGKAANQLQVVVR